jgi:hypothetical protein
MIFFNLVFFQIFIHAVRNCEILFNKPLSHEFILFFFGLKLSVVGRKLSFLVLKLLRVLLFCHATDLFTNMILSVQIFKNA